MSAEPDLFSYPRSPGFKERTTSRDTAIAIKDDAKILRELVIGCYERAGAIGLTADACAALLNRSVLAVRPRVSELVADGKVVATERTAKNDSGRPARIWRIAPCK